MKINNNILAKRIREEQEVIHREYNMDKPYDDTDTEVTTKDGIKYYNYNYDEGTEYTQGLNSNKSSYVIHKKRPKLVDTSNKPLPEYLYVADRSLSKSIPKLLSDEQLIWVNSPFFKNTCSYYIDDIQTDPNSLFDFFVTITPSFETQFTEQQLLKLTNLSFRQAQCYINPKNKHKIKDLSTLPNVKINVCKEYNTYVHLHIIIKAMSIREFKVLSYYLYWVFKCSSIKKADKEYHNTICVETSEDYTNHQILRTLFTKDIFGLK